MIWASPACSALAISWPVFKTFSFRSRPCLRKMPFSTPTKLGTWFMLLPMAAVTVVGVCARAPGATTTTAPAAIATRKSFMRSPREGIGAELELHDLARRSLAAFDVERRPRAVRRPQPLAFPACTRVVDAPVHPLGVEAHRIGDTQVDELAVHEGEQRLVGVAGGDRHVPAEPERVELIDPGAVAGLSAARPRHLSELGPGD